MFDKYFEKVALKRLQRNNYFDKLRAVRQDRFYRRKGWIVTFPNGTEGFDIVKANAHSLKLNVIFKYVCIPAAIVTGSVLGNISNSRR